MNETEKIKFSIADIMQELNKDNPRTAEDIIVLQIEDKFFMGGGCETDQTVVGPSSLEEQAPINVSVCVNGPMV